MKLTESIKWTPVGDGLPDSGTTVLLYTPDSCEPVGPGFHDGDRWRDTDGNQAPGVTHWAHLPAGPESASPFIHLDTLRSRCFAAADYLTDDQFAAAWRNTIKRGAKPRGYPRDRVAGLMKAIEDRAGYWADPNGKVAA